MKKLVLFFSLFTVIIVLNSFVPLTNNNQGLPHITFETEIHDFGTITQGGNGTYVFKFTNTGSEPLVISEARASCGCTVPSKPEAPILPGQSDYIKVTYDTQRIGAFQKYITINSNADNSSVTLTIKGDVKEKPKEEIPVRNNQGFSPIAK